MNTKEKIAQILQQHLTVNHLEIIDDSHLHIGHAGAKQGGHYTINISAAEFSGKTPIARHRLIYQLLDTLMKTEIHALAINAK